MRWAALASVFRVPQGDARPFLLTVCRHVLHSIPQSEQVLAELVRVTKRGGWLHLIPEDYGMLHFRREKPDVRDFWHDAAGSFGDRTNTDLFSGRHAFGHLAKLGLADIAVDYVVVDTIRVPRETFAGTLEAWRDGYIESIGELTRFTPAEAKAYFNQMIANIRDPLGYAVWFVPVVSARVP